MAQRTNSKESILDAAEDVVLETGASHLSLDVVAKKAGVSKGGLMYNFPTKDDLLKAMIARFIAWYYSQKEKMLERLKDDPQRDVKVDILIHFEQKERMRKAGQVILAAKAYNPELLEPLREAYQTHVDDLKRAGRSFERMAIISLATDGLLLWEILQLSPFNANQMKKIKETLLALAEEEG